MKYKTKTNIPLQYWYITKLIRIGYTEIRMKMFKKYTNVLQNAKQNRFYRRKSSMSIDLALIFSKPFCCNKVLTITRMSNSAGMFYRPFRQWYLGNNVLKLYLKH